jgi:tRNA(fMet)-specific endonuclease VapC
VTLFLLDTNIVSRFIRDDPPVVRSVIQVPTTSLGISAISQGELLFGLARRPNSVLLHQSVHEFLRRFEVLSWGHEEAEYYRVLKAELQRTGRVLSELDMLIAAHALAANAVLVTNDRAFRQVPGLTIEDWTIGAT